MPTNPQTNDDTQSDVTQEGFAHKLQDMQVAEPRPTVVQAPIQLRIADDIRMKIERGELAPGDSLPTLAEIREQWSCSMNSARGAIGLLKAQGLITVGRGKAPVVRVPPARVIRSSERHQAEKDLARRGLKERTQVGEAETNLNMPIANQDFSSRYAVIAASSELAEILHVEPSADLLERRFESTDRSKGHLLSASVSYLPKALIEANPMLLDETNEPWPGGTQHQLSTVGIEIMCMIDLVTARMPTTVEGQLWGLGDGIPLVVCRRLSLDADNRVVEISDATYPADRTELQFVTPLRAWPKPRRTEARKTRSTGKDAP